MSGNKVRKLDFIFGNAGERVRRCVTVGGVNSNHARTTAAYAAQLGIECHLVLRSPFGDEDETLRRSRSANLLVEALSGAHVHLVSAAEYRELGQHGLLLEMAQQLGGEPEETLLIPVGGSDPVYGVWGYIDCAREIAEQMSAGGVPSSFDYVVFACGSGGTAAGLAIGMQMELDLQHAGTQLRAISVCDRADYFYGHVDECLAAIGFPASLCRARDMLHVDDAWKGARYVDDPAWSTDDELAVVRDFARRHALVLDPCYTAKAMRAVLQDERYRGKRVLFINTGGPWGAMASAEQLWRAAERPLTRLFDN